MTDQQTPPASDRGRDIASGLVRVMLSMEGLYNRQSRKAGLTAQQAQLLCTAARRRAGVSELADVLHCGPSNVSRLLDRIAARGLAERGTSARDGRVAVVTLSQEGREIVQSFEGDLEARLTGIIADWPPEQQQAAAETLLALVGALDADMAAEDAADDEALEAEGDMR